MMAALPAAWSAIQALLKLAKGWPFLLPFVVALVLTFWYREQYRDQIQTQLQQQVVQATAEAEARELAQERQYRFMQTQLERLARERTELANRKRQEQAALAELNQRTAAGRQRLASIQDQIDDLTSDNTLLGTRLPDAVVRLFEPASDHNGQGS